MALLFLISRDLTFENTYIIIIIFLHLPAFLLLFVKVVVFLLLLLLFVLFDPCCSFPFLFSQSQVVCQPDS